MLSIVERSLPMSVAARGVPDDFNLLAEGVVDSLGFVELIAELEGQLAVEIDLGDLDSDKLGVVGPLSRYIAAKVGRE